MKVLAINCGSSTLKFQLIEVGGKEKVPSQMRRLAHGIIDRIGSRGAIEFTAGNGERLREDTAVANHDEATRRLLGWLDSTNQMDPDGLWAVRHRVVHGGDRFVEPTLIDDEVIDAIEGLSELAPLHNEPSLRAIRAVRVTLNPTVPMVAVFDTAFHHTLSERASRYAIPQELAARHRIRRYGFHGLAHRYMTERYATITSTPVAKVRLVTLQLGSYPEQHYPTSQHSAGGTFDF